MSLKQELSHLEVDYSIESAPTVKVNGEEITEHLTGIEFQMGVGRPPAVILYQTPGKAKLEGDAYIYVQSRIDGKVLDDLNAAEIEHEALSRQGWGVDKTIVELVIDVIKEKITSG